MSGALPPRRGLVAFMATLAGPEPVGFLELRHRRREASGMRQRFFDASQPQAAAMAATVLCQTGDVYVGCALRSYDSFLAWWWRHTELRDFDDPPFVHFVCQGDAQRDDFLARADRELTRHRWHPSRPARPARVRRPPTHPLLQRARRPPRTLRSAPNAALPVRAPGQTRARR